MITTPLLVTLGAHAVSAILLLIAAVFVYTRNPKKPLFRYYAFLAFTIFLFEAGFIVAPLIADYDLAYKVWLLNVVDVFIAIATSFFALELIGKVREHRWYLRTLIFIGLTIVTTTFAYPALFLPQIEPKLYFPWYLDGGPLYAVMLVYFVGALLYAFYRLIVEYLKTHKREYEFFLVMFFIAYTTGPLNFFLVFDFPVDPIYGFATGLSTVPLAYGILTDDLLDIRIIAKKALAYSAGVGATVFAIALLIFLNEQIVSAFPWVQFWTIPLIAGAGAFGIGRLFWQKSVESDRVKYEFVTVATHKLRTPLTQISWGTKALREDEQLTDAAKSILGRIEHANARLIELTNLIFESTQENASGYAYAREAIDLHAIAQEVVQTFEGIALQKQIQVHIDTGEAVPSIGDMRRMRSVLEVLVENALAYSPEKSEIHIQTFIKNNRAHFAIADQGFGVPSDEQEHIFTRFYRSDAAKRADTEGVGLGLAMAKNIIKTHKGRMGVESEGEGKGSTFWFWIPTT